MNRQELEGLDRDSLVRHAEALGVGRAGVLTRPELVDEILLRGSGGNREDSKVKAARGLFGRARDLLTRVIERGLHLPEAAERFRVRPAPVSTRANGTTPAVPTVTLAEIYASQGHKDKALDTLRKVLEAEPEHAAAKAMLAQIEATDLPAPVLPPEEDDPANGSSITAETAAEPFDPNKPFLLDDQPLPPKYDVDECVAIPVDPTTMFVYWEVRDATRQHLEKTRPHGGVTLRAVIVIPTFDGPRIEVRDYPVGSSVGDYFVRELPRGAIVRTAIGWRAGEAFVPSAHSPALETLANEPSPLVADRLVRWTPEGTVPLAEGDHEMPGVLRALGVVGARLRAQARAIEAGGVAPGVNGVNGTHGAPGMAGAGVTSLPYPPGVGGPLPAFEMPTSPTSSSWS